jgi:tetratricopeptide (TPR) repeat protein/transcriptional regulator with XRE-family HTH domain
MAGDHRELQGLATGEGAAFATWLSACRRSARLTQQELADRSGLSIRAISNLEIGRVRVPYLNTVRRLADALGLHGDSRAGFLAAAGRRLGGRAADEPGCGPGPELRRVQQQVLNEDPALATPEPASAAAGEGAVRVVPRELPAEIGHFTGRAQELRALTRMLEGIRDATTGAVVISVIGGTAGVGKTALAVRWARQVAGRFPDGQLYVNLRGYDPGSPVPAEDALAGFLRALGAPGQDIPAGPDERAARYRSLLAGRRVLVVLDNARDAEQIRPLLPGAPGCLALVTSRDAQAGLIARDGAERLDLDLLPLPDAVILLRLLIGSRADADPQTTAALAAQCARLPLALRIAAELAVARPTVPLLELVRELADQQQRLDLLEAAGDGRTAIRAVFSWSYKNLTPQAARMFRLLGLHPGRDLTACGAASLAHTTPAQAGRLLAELARTHLLTEQVPGRYGCHDLLRAYAIEHATTTGSRAGRRAAQGRLLDYYLHTAAIADRLLYPLRRRVDLAELRPGVEPENLTSHDQALAWLDAEHRGLLAAIHLAADHGFDVHAWQLPFCLETFFYRRSHWEDWAATQQAALAAACRLGDSYAQTLAHSGIANAQLQTGRPAEALRHLATALRLREQAGDLYGQARVHLYTGWALESQGRYNDALAHSRRGLRLAETAGLLAQPLLAEALNQVGWDLAKVGRYREALGYCQRAVTLSHRLGNKHTQPAMLDSLAYVYQHLGQHAESADCYSHAVELLDELGHRYQKADTLAHAGDAHHADGNLPAARQAWTQALAILEDLHHPDAEPLRAKLHPPMSAPQVPS